MNTHPDLKQLEAMCETTTRLALNALRLARMDGTASNVIAIIETAPRNPVEERSHDHRRNSFCRNCLDVALEWAIDEGSDSEERSHGEAEHHFISIIPSLSPETRMLLESANQGVCHGRENSEIRAADFVG